MFYLLTEIKVYLIDVYHRLLYHNIQHIILENLLCDFRSHNRID
jgi:hypothetical protein